jgi:hypothetical protein
MPAQRDVLFAGEGQAESALARVIGKMDDSATARRERRPRPVFVAVEPESPGRRAQSAERFDELGLPVSFDAGHAEDLAPCDRKGGAAKAAASSFGAAPQVDALEPRRSGRRKRSSGLGSRGGPAHHRSGELLRAHRGGGAREHDAAAAEDGDPVRHRPHLAELVRDEEDGAPRPGKLAHRAEQLRDLCRSEE